MAYNKFMLARISHVGNGTIRFGLGWAAVCTLWLAVVLKWI